MLMGTKSLIAPSLAPPAGIGCGLGIVLAGYTCPNPKWVEVDDDTEAGRKGGVVVGVVGCVVVCVVGCGVVGAVSVWVSVVDTWGRRRLP